MCSEEIYERVVGKRVEEIDQLRFNNGKDEDDAIPDNGKKI